MRDVLVVDGPVVVVVFPNQILCRRIRGLAGQVYTHALGQAQRAVEELRQSECMCVEGGWGGAWERVSESVCA